MYVKKEKLKSMKEVIMFKKVFFLFSKSVFKFLLLLSLLSCSFERKSLNGSVVQRNSDYFDLNHLNWLWNFDYEEQNFDEYFGIDSSSYVYVAYLFRKIGYEEKFREYMLKAIEKGNDIVSQFAGVKLLEYHNARREYYEAELIGRKLYKKYEDNKYVVLGYFKVFIGKKE